MRRMRVLHEFARHGSIADAAVALYLTPSAVSQQLSVLQREVGQELLEPVGRRIRLTEAGRTLAGHAADILTAEERARIALERQRTTLTADLEVGVLATVAASLVPPTLSLLARRHPGITIRTREVTPEEAVVAVHDGDLDISFILDYPDSSIPWSADLDATVVAIEHLHLVTPAASEQFGGGPVHLNETAGLDWIASGARTDFGRAFLAACRRAGFEPRIRHRVDEQATAMAMVAGGLGVTLAADLGLFLLRPPGVEVHRLAQPFLRRVLLLRRHTSRPSETAFARTAVDAALGLGL